MLEILNSFLLVSLTEMGDKTQLLALVLSCRFKKPWTIMAAILLATVGNHFFAAFLGKWVSYYLPNNYLYWVLGVVFIAFAFWVLIPDEDENNLISRSTNVFFTTLITFFIAEMGDKTQLSTIALAAKYGNIWFVTMGTTMGMLFADGLAVFYGDGLTRVISMKWIRVIAALFFLATGIGVIFRF